MLRSIENTQSWEEGSWESFDALLLQEQCSDLLIEVNDLYNGIEGKIKREKDGDGVVSSECMVKARDLILEFGTQIGELWGVAYKKDEASKDLRRKYAASMDANEIGHSEEYSPSEKDKIYKSLNQTSISSTDAELAAASPYVTVLSAEENVNNAKKLLSRLKRLKVFLSVLDKARNILKAKNFQNNRDRYKIENLVRETSGVLRDIINNPNRADEFLDSFVPLVNRVHNGLFGNELR